MLRSIKSLQDLGGKRVILRCDFNVPLSDGQITDDGRIRAALPTIKHLISAGARLVICSHLGRPEGQVNTDFSLEPVATRLEELLGQPVVFSFDTIGVQAKAASKLLEDGGVALIENLRFSPLETSSDQAEREEFAKSLAELGDVLVSDGFGVVHRKQASVYELAKLLPSYAGLLIEREVEVLRSLTENPERPYCVVLGGSKVSDKLAVIENLLPKVDKLLVGGGMVFTLLAAKGHDVASSLLESDQLETVRGFLAQADQLGVEILLPSDIVVASGFSKDAEFETVAADRIAESRFGVSGIGLDIGPESAKRFAEVVRSSKTVFWNGPMGVFEFDNFSHGTKAVAQALTEIEGLSVVGGGDSASAVRALGFADDAFGHISTGGGASLEYLEGKKLPGLEVLDD
ncbi:MAG: phosphoglycerate kinase [Actinobacteria bacterium]|nr:phosphoglycerate kinase [Actinomycetota bacterium]